MEHLVRSLVARPVLLLAIAAGLALGDNAKASDEQIDNPVAYTQNALRLIEKNAYYADRVNWTKAYEQALNSLGPGSSNLDAYAEIRRVLLALGDGHSFLMTAQSAHHFDLSGEGRVEVRLESQGIAYIRLDGYSGGDMSAIDAYVHDLSARFDAVSVGGICGWIVDLRQNRGGNMWPMLAGLHDILGADNLGAFIDRRGKQYPWAEGSLVQNARNPRYVDAPVAVLIGNATASSGEAIVVAFAGRPRTRTFGQPTRGLSTANHAIRLPDGAMLFLTASIFVDRTGKVYGTAISPDEASDDDSSTVSKARSWLATQPCAIPSRNNAAVVRRRTDDLALNRTGRHAASCSRAAAGPAD